MFWMSFEFLYTISLILYAINSRVEFAIINQKIFSSQIHNFDSHVFEWLWLDFKGKSMFDLNCDYLIEFIIKWPKSNKI